MDLSRSPTPQLQEPMEPFKIDIVRGFPAHVKIYIGFTGSSLRFEVIYKVIGGWSMLQFNIAQRMHTEDFAVYFYQNDGSPRRVLDDKDVFDAFLAFGMEQSLDPRRSDTVFFIAITNKRHEQGMAITIERLIFKPMTLEGQQEFQHRISIMPTELAPCSHALLLPDSRGKVPVSFFVQEIETEIERLKNENKEDDSVGIQDEIDAHQEVLKFITTP